MKIKFKTHVKNQGSSLYLLIPRQFSISHDINDKDEVEVELDLKARDAIESPYTSFKCRACNHTFDMEEDEAYCPVCESTDLLAIEE